MESISVTQLSQALKWGYTAINLKLCLPQFAPYIAEYPNKRMIKIKDLPKVTQMLYEVMEG